MEIFYITLRRLIIDICARFISSSRLKRSISQWSKATGRGLLRRANSFRSLKLKNSLAARLAGRAFISRLNMTFPFAASGSPQGASFIRFDDGRMTRQSPVPMHTEMADYPQLSRSEWN